MSSTVSLAGTHPVVAVKHLSLRIVFGVVLLLVALAFEYGERLQSDSDGLV